MCFTDQKGAAVHVHEVETQHTNEPTEPAQYFLGGVTSVPDDRFLGVVNAKDRDWVVNLKMGGSPVTFKIDTGADVTVMSERVWQQMAEPPPLSETKTQLTSPGGELQSVGEFLATTEVKGVEHTVRVIVIKGALASNLLGRDAAIQMGLVARLQEVSNDNKVGLMKTKPVSIQLKEGAEPFCLHTARNVPLPLMEKVKDELKRMEDNGVIRPMTEPSEWCAPMVPVLKPSGQVRICVDLQVLNKAVKREHLTLPTLEDIAPKLAGSTVFSSLDAESGFWQIPLEQRSQELTTFITPYGRYCFQRVPFGITSASEIFQRKMEELLKDHEGVEVIVDDILVHGRTMQEHDARLKKVMETVTRSGVRLNHRKCQYRKRELTYFGHIVGAEGIKPHPDKTSALRELPTPMNVEELRRILGMFNYLGRFLPNLSTVAKPMSDLLKGETAWFWGPDQVEAFQRCKDLLSKAPSLQFYNAALPTVVAADASAYGLGAVLQQEHGGELRPVAYCSRTLTDAEQRYAQIEKECLAAVWACEKFAKYLVGLPTFTLLTDHKPLVPLLGSKPLHMAPLRCQRLLMRMLRFNFNPQHVAGKDLVVADALSRSPVSVSTKDNSDLVQDVTAHVDAVRASWPATDAKLKEYVDATEDDEILKMVRHYTKVGWPRHTAAVPANVMAYHPWRGDLSVTKDGLVTFQNRIVIPRSCRADVLQRLHGSHQGLAACRARACEAVWWPNIGQDLKNLVLNCEYCRLHRPSQRHEPLQSTALPDRPWAKLAADLCEHKGRIYLVLADYYSRWLEIKQLVSTTSPAVCNKLMEIFAIHGFPDELKTDNGPQFSSQAFKDFADKCGFSHVTSSPHFHQANGLAERAVQTAKRILNLSDPLQGLLDYRATPCSSTGVSPAAALMSRSLKTRVPVLTGHLQPAVPNPAQIRARDLAAKASQKRAYDRRHGVRTLPRVHEGTSVLLKTDEQEGWRRGGIVTTANNAARSYIVATPTGELRRNRKHIAPAAPAPPATATPSEDVAIPAPPDPPEPSTAVADPLPPSLPDAASQQASSLASPQASGRPQRNRRMPARFKDYV